MKPFRMATASLVTLAASSALANSPAPADYWIAQEAGNVRICTSFRTCPDDGLLRRNVASGEVVGLTSCDVGGCFVDECVPAGTYQYGFATPYACEVAGSYYYGQVDAPGAAPACVRTAPPPVPAASVPWSDGRQICPSTYRWPEYTSGCGSAGAVLGLDGLLVVAGLLLARRRSARTAR